MEFYDHLGREFTDHNGVFIQCWQLVSKSDGKAYAIADFEGGICYRFFGGKDIKAESDAFLRRVTDRNQKDTFEAAQKPSRHESIRP